MCVNPSSDIFVKYLLGSEGNNDILLSFINAVLTDYDFLPIQKVTVLNPFNIPDMSLGKVSVLDVKAQDEEGRWYDIEVQTTASEHFALRSVYYLTKLMSNQLEAGDQYQTLEPVIAINLLDFVLFPKVDKAHNCFMLIEKNDSSLVLTDHMQLHFIEIPKLDKVKSEALRDWLEYFTYEGSREDKMETLIKRNPSIAKAHNVYNYFTQDQKLRALYDSREKAERDLASALGEAEEKGIEKGIEKGKYENALQVAKILKLDGISVSQIAKATGLSISEIEKL